MDRYEVLSAFLDDEPLDPAELAPALADQAGRQLLVDLVALRTLVREEPIAAPAATAERLSRPRWIAVGFLAASVLFGAAGTWLWSPRARPQSADQVPPTPTHVVTFQTGAGAP